MTKQKRRVGRPSLRTPEVEKRILDGLTAGTPLAVICRGEGMPHPHTVYDWLNADPELAAKFAMARETGWDQIALDALRIADDGSQDTLLTERGPKPDREWIERSKLRVHTRLQLLAKWDPKRYGEMIKHAGADGGSLNIVVSSEDAGL
jgi:hypothetical protein